MNLSDLTAFLFMTLQMYWEFVILLRKLAIVSIAVGLRGSPSYQLAVMLLVLFCAFAAQVKHNPYFSHSDRPLIIAEHEAKRLTDPLHVMIEEDMRAIARSNVLKGTRVQRFFDPNSLRKGLTVDAALLVALDYNTVRDSAHSAFLISILAIRIWCRLKLSCLHRQFSFVLPA